jgi:hypothetical protein
MGLIHDVPTCKEWLERIEREAEEVLSGLNGQAHGGQLRPSSKL